jgi:hypothetical protein
MSRLRTALLFAVMFVAFHAPAQSALNGKWTGTYSLNFQVSGCSATFTMNGNATLMLLQTGTSFTGRMDLTNVMLFGSTCTPTLVERAMPIVGAVDGSDVTWHMSTDPNGAQFDGTLNGNVLSVQVTGSSGGTGTATFTRADVDPQAADLTGTWSGTYAFTDRCANGSTKSYSGQWTFGLKQSAGFASGVVTMTNVPLYDQNCATVTLQTLSLTAAGVVTGSTISAAVYDPSGLFDFAITATRSGGSLKGSVAGVSDTSTAGDFTSGIVASTAPDTAFAGGYAGTYTESDNLVGFCANIATVRFSGPATVSVAQSGNAVSAVILFDESLQVISDGRGFCDVVDGGQELFPLYGTLNGGVVNLLESIGGGAQELIGVTFTGDTSIGTFSDSFGDGATFSATRTAASPLPSISFGATPPSIAPGEHTTLFWSVSNATAVTIDNGVGSLPPSSTITVTPLQTTTYTLTATGPGGLSKSSITVVVAPDAARHRAVRP